MLERDQYKLLFREGGIRLCDYYCKCISYTIIDKDIILPNLFTVSLQEFDAKKGQIRENDCCIE